MLRKLERRAENNFLSYWSNPIHYKCTPPGPDVIDELKLLGGEKVVINHQSSGSRSRSVDVPSQDGRGGKPSSLI